MLRTSLIRLGGLVSIVGGVSYATLGFMTWLCTPNCPRSSGYVIHAFFVLLVFGAMVALASLHAIQRQRYGLLGTVVFLVAFVGVAMIFVSEVRSLILALWQGSPGAGGVSWLFIIGLLAATVGLIAYGVTIITASALPWCCGLALIAGSPFVGLFLYLFSPVEESLIGVPWVLVGFSIFRATTRPPEHPSRVRLEDRVEETMNQATQTPKPEGRLVRFLLAALFALICGVGADVVLVLPYAFSSEPWRMWFAAFGIGALFAALAAGWVGTLGASDRTRSRLLIVVGTSEAAALVVAVAGFLVLRSAVLGSSALLPVLSVLFLGLGITVVALGGSWAAMRFRSPRRNLTLDILATVGLLALMVVVHVQTIIFAPLT